MKSSEKAMALVIGHRIRTQRLALGLSQSDLASAICSQAGISLFENGTDLPTPDTLGMVAERLNDAVLLKYAQRILDGNDFYTDDEDVELLFQALTSRHGRLSSEHLNIATTLLDTLYQEGRIDDVIEMSSQLIHQCEKLGVQADIHYVKACFYHGSGNLFKFNFADAAHWLRQSYKSSDAVDLIFSARICYNLAYAFNGSHKYGQALWYAQQAEQIFKGTNSFLQHGKTLALIGVVQGHLGMCEESIDVLKTGISLLERWDGHSNDIVRAYACLADQYLSLQELELARINCEYVVKAEDLMASDHTLASSVHRLLCVIEHLSGNSELALNHFSTAYTAAEQSTDAWTIARTALLGLFVLHDDSRRLELAKLVVSQPSTIECAFERGLAFEYIAKWFAKERDYKKALSNTGQAVETYKQVLRARFGIPLYLGSI